MAAIVQAGLAAVSVTSGAEADLLIADPGLVGIGRVTQWSLVVETTQDITVRVYKAAGPNADAVIVSDLTSLVTASAPLIIEWYGEANYQMRVTGQAASATASVNCDFRGVGLI
jgi:hypothetical protein